MKWDRHLRLGTKTAWCCYNIWHRWLYPNVISDCAVKSKHFIESAVKSLRKSAAEQRDGLHIIKMRGAIRNKNLILNRSAIFAVTLSVKNEEWPSLPISSVSYWHRVKSLGSPFVGIVISWPWAHFFSVKKPTITRCSEKSIGVRGAAYETVFLVGSIKVPADRAVWHESQNWWHKAMPNRTRKTKPI